MMNQSQFLIRPSLPDYITLTGGAITLFAIFCALNNAVWLSVSFLYLAMLADALDGKVARNMAILRPFGRYLDGFADLLLYLIAPALLYHLGGFQGIWSCIIALTIGCGCIRLSCFNESGNIERKNTLAYMGMPVFWNLFILSFWMLIQLATTPSVHLPLLGLLLVLFSLAMISARPFFKFTSLKSILFICCSGFLIFGVLHIFFTYGQL